MIGVLKKCIPGVGQLVFPQVHIKGSVIHMDEHDLLNGPGDAVCLPVYNSETGYIYWMSCGLAVMVD